ncbi:zinc finger protein Dzip1 isoform X2 [Hypomesus transpacificus]|uniref:zinc finger protein Dzip1 isoform X2 n=1 Tax=Hypomesus transpacificus TaxID=137520 RepID=UPI001F07E7DD|nr:zinc finger protein Dzip1 isoform X2 [Hypomesus transpacificus]
MLLLGLADVECLAPFYNNIYYPYTRETQGTHSSAGIPSLLNSPLSQPYTSGPPPPAMSASSSTTIPPFKFRQRRESVDWRRVSAVDVDLVASELDFLTLQEHVQGVTFCSVEGERCSRCQSPVDPALLKLFRLAQLTVEYLLHSQEVLTLSLQAAEERLRAAGLDRDQVLAQQQKQAEEITALKAELRHRKKIIKSHQNVLASRLTNCHKCQHCDKAFMNSSFLQNHMQRRHPEEYDSQCRSDSERKHQITSLKGEVVSLKEEVISLKGEVNQQQQALRAKTTQEKDQAAMHEELERLDRKLQDTTGGIRRELDMFHRNNAQLQVARQEPDLSVAPRQVERDHDQDRALHRLTQQIKQQDKKWESALQKMRADHESETAELQRELSRMQSSLSEQLDRGLRQREEMSQRLQEKELTIVAQREQIRHISLNPPTKVVEVPVLVSAPAPAPKPKRVMSEQPPSATKLDPIEEMSEEEKDSSSVSGRPEATRPEVKKPEQKQEARKQAAASVTTPRVLRKIPDIQRELRPALEQALLEKLETLGVRAGLTGLRNREYSDLVAKVRLERESVARDVPGYWRHRKEVAHTLERRLKGKKTGGQQAKPRTPTQVTQSRARSSSLPSRVTQVMSGPVAKQVQPPQPAPRTKTSTLPKTSTPRTPPFSSDEESEDEEETEEEEEEEEEQPQKQRPERGPQHKAPPPRTTQPQPKPSQGRPTHTKPIQARPTHTKPTPARPSHAKTTRSNLSQTQPPPPKTPQQPKGRVVDKNKTAVNAGRTAVTAVESEGEWTDGSEMEEIDLQQLQNYTDQNGNVGKTTNNNLVKGLTKSLEKQLADRGPKKPVGGVSTLPESKDVVRELKYTEMDESSEDWDVSSLEDLALPEGSKAAPGPAPVRKSLDSSGTSVWGTSTGKRGLSETGTGSTLKSSLVSVSDFSDTDDI